MTACGRIVLYSVDEARRQLAERPDGSYVLKSDRTGLGAEEAWRCRSTLALHGRVWSASGRFCKVKSKRHEAVDNSPIADQGNSRGGPRDIFANLIPIEHPKLEALDVALEGVQKNDGLASRVTPRFLPIPRLELRIRNSPAQTLSGKISHVSMWIVLIQPPHAHVDMLLEKRPIDSEETWIDHIQAALQIAVHRGSAGQ